MAPLLTEHPSHEGAWECSVCAEKYSEPPPKPWEDSSTMRLVREPCIHEPFEKALKFDYHMPAVWGEEMDINDYAYTLLDADFVLAYSNAWFRKMARFAEEASRPRDAATLASEIPDGLEPGRQCQRCPVCLEPVQLLEACNHMTCPKPCETDYCYICGREVHVGKLSTHWTTGGCPQYGNPDDEDATFAPMVMTRKTFKESTCPQRRSAWRSSGPTFTVSMQEWYSASLGT
jgi:hypothetical protein